MVKITKFIIASLFLVSCLQMASIKAMDTVVAIEADIEDRIVEFDDRVVALIREMEAVAVEADIINRIEDRIVTFDEGVWRYALKDEINGALAEVKSDETFSDIKILKMLEEYEKQVEDDGGREDSCETDGLIEYEGANPLMQCESYVYQKIHGIVRTKKCWLLRLAVFHGHLEAVKKLLRKGARCKANRFGWTPLHYAAYQGNIKMLAILLEDAYPKCTGCVKNSTIAARNKKIVESKKTNWARNSLLETPILRNIVPYLDSEVFPSTPLVQHTCEARTAKMRSKKINAFSKSGLSPLVCAVMRNKTGAVKFLLQRWSPVEALIETNEHIIPPLHCAAWNGNCEIIRAILNYIEQIQRERDNRLLREHLNHASPSTVCSQEDGQMRRYTCNTPFHIAVLAGEPRVMELLLEKGASQCSNEVLVGEENGELRFHKLPPWTGLFRK